MLSTVSTGSTTIRFLHWLLLLVTIDCVSGCARANKVLSDSLPLSFQFDFYFWETSKVEILGWLRNSILVLFFCWTAELNYYLQARVRVVSRWLPVPVLITTFTSSTCNLLTATARILIASTRWKSLVTKTGFAPCRSPSTVRTSLRVPFVCFIWTLIIWFFFFQMKATSCWLLRLKIRWFECGGLDVIMVTTVRHLFSRLRANSASRLRVKNSCTNAVWRRFFKDTRIGSTVSTGNLTLKSVHFLYQLLFLDFDYVWFVY